MRLTLYYNEYHSQQNNALHASGTCFNGSALYRRVFDLFLAFGEQNPTSSWEFMKIFGTLVLSERSEIKTSITITLYIVSVNVLLTHTISMWNHSLTVDLSNRANVGYRSWSMYIFLDNITYPKANCCVMR